MPERSWRGRVERGYYFDLAGFGNQSNDNLAAGIRIEYKSRSVLLLDCANGLAAMKPFVLHELVCADCLFAQFEKEIQMARNVSAVISSLRFAYQLELRRKAFNTLFLYGIVTACAANEKNEKWKDK